MATSAWPSAMALRRGDQRLDADVAQARATVCASILRGSPAASTTSRAMLVAVSVGITWPKTQLVDLVRVELGALHQLLHHDAAQVERRQLAEDACPPSRRGS